MAPLISDPGPTLTPILRAIMEREPLRVPTPAPVKAQPSLELDTQGPGKALVDPKFTGVLNDKFIEELTAKLESVFRQARGLEKSLSDSRSAVSEKLLQLADELLRTYVLIAAVATATGDESAAAALAKQAETLLGRAPEAIAQAKEAIESSDAEADEDADERAADLLKLASSLAASARSIAGYADKAAEDTDEDERQAIGALADRLRSRADGLEQAAIGDSTKDAGERGTGSASRTPSPAPTLLSTEA